MNQHKLARAARLRRRGLLGFMLLLPTLPFVAMSLEARPVEFTNSVVRIAGLPTEFAGLRIALLADVHRGPFLSSKRIRHLVDRVNEQQPDVIAMAGDYVHHSPAYIPSVWKEFSRLRAPLGVFAVLGNHDYWEDGDLSLRQMEHAGITSVINRNIMLERDGERMFISGVDDAWAGQPDLQAALEGVGEDEVAVVICHNPDYIEQESDPRARLWLAGHTHGGQVCLPTGRPFIHPSKCGLRYIAGLATCEGMQIYISRGVGTVAPPWRWNCPAEIPIIELQPAK